MDVIDVISVTVGVVGLAVAGWFYYHLWKWARDCQQATVAIAYKRKVVMSPTLVELLLWSRKVPDGQGGQTFYKGPNVTIAIVKRERRSLATRWRLRKNRQSRRFGSWAMRQDKSNASS